MVRFLAVAIMAIMSSAAYAQDITIIPVSAQNGIYQARISNATILAATPWRSSLVNSENQWRYADVMIRSGTHTPASQPTVSGTITSATFTFGQYPTASSVMVNSVTHGVVPSVNVVNPADGTFKSVSPNMTTYGLRQYPAAGRYFNLILTSGTTITSQNFIVDIVFRR